MTGSCGDSASELIATDESTIHVRRLAYAITAITRCSLISFWRVSGVNAAPSVGSAKPKPSGIIAPARMEAGNRTLAKSAEAAVA